MPTAYRVELAKTGRAGCQHKECKDKGDKIGKGELRLGTLVEIMERQSFVWRHWGCVTPIILANWSEISGGDEDLLDGFEDVDDDAKDKIRRALKLGHVDDSEWKGDIEKNRPGQKGYRLTKAEQKKKDASADDDDSPKANKKRARAPKKEQLSADEDDEEDVEAPPPKKARGKASKKVKKEDTNGTTATADDDDKEPPAKAKKGAAKKSKPVKEESPVSNIEEDVETEEVAPEPAKKKAGRPKKEKVAKDAAPAEKKKPGRPKKAADAAAPAKKAPGRPKKSKAIQA